MKNLKKKGFTIVELVIVIAVIAILSAVLIPTFSNLVKKANISADQQAVASMNKYLKIDEVENGKPTKVDEVVEVLINNDYNSDLTTYYKGYTLAWLSEENMIVLVEDNKVVYPAEYVDATTFTEIKPMVKDSEALLGSLETGKTVFVAEDIATDGLKPVEMGEFSVNLNGNKLNTTNRVQSTIEGAKLVVSNGSIYSDLVDRTFIYVTAGGELELNNVQVYAQSNANPIQCYGGTMTLNNVVAAQSGNADVAWYNSTIQVINKITQNEDEKWVINGPQANLTVNGGVFTGKKAIQISAPGGNVTINSGNFSGTEQVINADFAPQNYIDGTNYESVITINGGSFDGKIKISAATELVINGGLFTMDELKIDRDTYTGDKIWEALSAYVTYGSTITLNGVQYTKLD